MINPEIIYESIRTEIIEQKKCQFHLFGAALTMTAAILAYGSSAKVGPLIYIAPILMNVLSLTIILDKAISIQRMVGYLQLMESESDEKCWMWEYHLNIFREHMAEPCGEETFRKHTYVRNVALMLLILNIITTLIYFFGPESVALRNSPEYQGVREFYGGIHTLVLLVNAGGIYISVRRWKQLIKGPFTSKAIRKRWKEVIRKPVPNSNYDPSTSAERGAD